MEVKEIVIHFFEKCIKRCIKDNFDEFCLPNSLGQVIKEAIKINRKLSEIEFQQFNIGNYQEKKWCYDFVHQEKSKGIITEKLVQCHLLKLHLIMSLSDIMSKTLNSVVHVSVETMASEDCDLFMQSNLVEKFKIIYKKYIEILNTNDSVQENVLSEYNNHSKSYSIEENSSENWEDRNEKYQKKLFTIEKNNNTSFNIKSNIPLGYIPQVIHKKKLKEAKISNLLEKIQTSLCISRNFTPCTHLLPMFSCISLELSIITGSVVCIFFSSKISFFYKENPQSLEVEHKVYRLFNGTLDDNSFLIQKRKICNRNRSRITN